MTPTLTLSVISHGNFEQIPSLIHSLFKHENTKQFELILTDNLENDFPDFDATHWGTLHIIRNKHPLGFAENHNQALRFAKSNYIAILNPDVVLEAPVFNALIKSLEANNLDVIAPTIVDEEGVRQDSFRRLPTPLKLIKRRLLGEQIESYQVDSQGLIYPDWIAGMFWLMKLDTFHKLNGLDEKFRLYFEDVDFCTRAQLAGMKIAVDTNVQVQHHAQRSSRRKVYYLYLHIISAVKFFLSSVYWQALSKK
jgi:N-acetylglucosaminyl-diphospho-decaprenol L-rhamnosyltransferase